MSKLSLDHVTIGNISQKKDILTANIEKALTEVDPLDRIVDTET
jgi:hypothetical protein